VKFWSARPWESPFHGQIDQALGSQSSDAFSNRNVWFYKGFAATALLEKICSQSRLNKAIRTTS